MNLATQTCHSLGRSRLAASTLCIALAASGGLTARAQTAPATPAAGGEEIVKLPTFSVSTERDYGYRASNSIAGSRTNTPIKDLPVNIQVFTKDLMDDLGLMTQVDLESYNGSLVNGGSDRNSNNAIQQAYNAFLFRGFQQNWGLRDGLREYDPVDLQGIARVEVVKGPVAALYGLTYPGGVMQNITKAVDFAHSFARAGVSIDSEGEYRVSLDANTNGALNGGKFGVRLNSAYTRSKDQRAHSEGKIEYNSVNAAWQPMPGTTVEVLAEKGYREKPNGLGYFSTGEAGGLSDINKSNIPLQIVHPEIPWEWNWADGVNMRNLDTKLYRGKITQSVGDLDLQAHWQYSARQQKDGNGWEANGNTQSGDGWEAGGGWTTYAGQEVIEMGYSYRDWSNQMHTYGFTGVYKFETAETKHTFAFGANAWAEKFVSRAGNQSQSASPIHLRFPVKANIDTSTSYAPPPDFQPMTDGNGYTHENNSNDYYFANWQMSAFNNRLNTNVSINRTNVKLLQWANGRATTPGATEQSKTSPMVGGIYKVTDDVSVFALYSTSLFPDSGKDSRGAQFTPQVGKGFEGGVKFETADGMLSGTVSYFSILREGGSQNDPNKNNVNTDLYDSMTPAQRAVAFPSGRPLGDLIQGGEQESKGFEVDVVYQPTKNWQLVGSFANVDHEFTKSAVAATIGETYPQAIKTRYSLLTRYTFSEGEAKGAFVGLGISGGSKALIDYQNFGGKDVARYEPARMNVDLFTGYKLKLFNRDANIQLNVRNLTGEDDYQGWKATGSATILATERYSVPLPRIYRLSLSIDL
ncbi:MAG TPA: TonB-dependent receptor [Lacunisphaera sp.]|nr:TonB-dependent receptor [Lacunisphaera sp.]